MKPRPRPLPLLLPIAFASAWQIGHAAPEGPPAEGAAALQPPAVAPAGADLLSDAVIARPSGAASVLVAGLRIEALGSPQGTVEPESLDAFAAPAARAIGAGLAPVVADEHAGAADHGSALPVATTPFDPEPDALEVLLRSIEFGGTVDAAGSSAETDAHARADVRQAIRAVEFGVHSASVADRSTRAAHLPASPGASESVVPPLDVEAYLLFACDTTDANTRDEPTQALSSDMWQTEGSPGTGAVQEPAATEAIADAPFGEWAAMRRPIERVWAAIEPAVRSAEFGGAITAATAADDPPAADADTAPAPGDAPDRPPTRAAHEPAALAGSGEWLAPGTLAGEDPGALAEEIAAHEIEAKFWGLVAFVARQRVERCGADLPLEPDSESAEFTPGSAFENSGAAPARGAMDIAALDADVLAGATSDADAWPHESGQPEPVAAFGTGAQVVAASQLDEMRGGFDTPQGGRIAFGFERAVYVNGQLFATQTLNVEDLARLAGSGQPGAAVVQNGANNVASLAGAGSGSAPLIIQNSLNDQVIRTVTTISASVPALSTLRAVTQMRAITQGVIDAVRR
jgi:hypothetical protein